jgi:putative ABC transport system permease protein
MHALLRDLRYGARILARRPGFTAVAVLCLAVGIGANTAVFSAAYAIVLRELPFPEADSLVELRVSRLTPTTQESKFLSIAKSEDIISQSKALLHVGRYIPANLTFTGTANPEQLTGLYVTPEWFDALGVSPQLGRRVLKSDIASDQDAVVVLSYGLWQRLFGGRSDVIGTEMLLAAQPANAFTPFAARDKPYVVIGIMPPRRMFPVDGDVWIALRPEHFVASMGPSPRAVRNVATVARIRTGTSQKALNVELRTIASRLAEEYPDTDKGWDLRAVPLREAITEHYGTIVTLLLIAVDLVLLLTCVCISGLMTARNRTRAQEVAIRETLGASRLALFRQFLSESVLLAAAGGAAGVAIAYWLLDVVRGTAPASIARLDGVGLEPRVLLYTAAISLLAGVAVGVLPAIRLTDRQLGTTIKDHQSRERTLGGGYRFRIRGLLIGFEIALAFPVAVGAALTVQSIRNVRHVDLGYVTTHVVSANVRLSSTTCATFDACIAAIDDIVARVHQLPGVRTVAVAGARPLSIPLALPVTADKTWDKAHPGTAIQAEFHVVTPEYFQTLGIVLRSGRFL